MRGAAAPVPAGTHVRVRGDLALDIGRNVVHGSDSVGSAKRELALYFTKDDFVDWTPANAKWVKE